MERIAVLTKIFTQPNCQLQQSMQRAFFESLELPLFICQAQIEVVEIPDMLLQTKNVFWEEGSNYSFIELQNGYGMYDQFTCYQGQKFQLLGNNCKNQSAQVRK
eukprot:TRINITY_DN7454_c0_g2_i1.p5 TRINITY_DN7454_c0_g2~~TRINITY_DN7454_c0_g2_i1.p5  ORF type:complete len:104 (-),score=4.51 TRINITY_DN7454_c0_g2_i1:93-404(-)